MKIVPVFSNNVCFLINFFSVWFDISNYFVKARRIEKDRKQWILEYLFLFLVFISHFADDVPFPAVGFTNLQDKALFSNTSEVVPFNYVRNLFTNTNKTIIKNIELVIEMNFSNYM